MLRANSMTAHCSPRQMPKKRDTLRPDVVYSLDLSLDAPLAEPRRNQQAGETPQMGLGAVPLDVLRPDP